MIRAKKSFSDYSAVVETAEIANDPACHSQDHLTVPIDEHAPKRLSPYDTRRPIMKEPKCSKQKKIFNKSPLPGSTENPPCQGLTMRLPHEKVRIRNTSFGNLLYDLYAPQSYLIRSSRCISHLRIEEISVSGPGHVLFRHKLKTRLKKTRSKAIVRDTKLYLPLPRDFEGTIRVDQYIGALKIIASKTSTVQLYSFDSLNNQSPKRIGTYSSKIS